MANESRFHEYTFGIKAHNSSMESMQYFKAKSMHYGWESLASEDSGRTLDGVMHIYWVLRKIRKLEIVMPPCDHTTIENILNIVQGKEYDIYYYDPAIGNWVSRYVYTSNAASDMYSGVVLNGLWQDFEFHAIELGGDTY